MDVAIAGGHGKIALRLERLLADGGHHVRALIRNPDHAAEVEAAGAEPVVLDLEALAGVHELTEAIAGADAVVFAAGAGPGSGAERKRTVDYGGAVKLIAAAQAADVDRYVMVSSIGADRPEQGQGPMRAYLQAKADADDGTPGQRAVVDDRPPRLAHRRARHRPRDRRRAPRPSRARCRATTSPRCWRRSSSTASAPGGSSRCPRATRRCPRRWPLSG